MSSSSETSVPQTKFEESELLTPQQLSNYWDSFPYSVRKALNKTKKGQLPKVSDEELILRLKKYNSVKNDEHGSCTNGECPK
jgi:hypothetical protein